MNGVTQWTLILSALVFVLGFVALLCSKIYIVDKGGGNQPTQVDLPLIGKMKTNYPALVFVIAGTALAVYTLNQYYQSITHPVLWNIKGHLQQPGHDISDWRLGELKLVALGPDVQIKEDGEYEVNVEIPAGETFESAVQQIYYTAANGSAMLVPSKAYEDYRTDPSKSQLETVTPTTRVYRPTPVTIIPNTGGLQ